MDKFSKEFLMELFLDNDGVTTMNRVAVAVADVVHENAENISKFCDLLHKDHPQMVRDVEVALKSAKPSDDVVTRKRKRNLYGNNSMNFTEEEYVEKFRMKKSTVDALVVYLKEYVKPGASIVPLDKKVHVFLYILTSELSFGDIGTMFGLHKSSVAYIFHEIATLLAEQRYNFISWPSIEDQHITRIKVNSTYRFPNCVGFIDARNFKVGSKKYKKSKLSKQNTVVLQAVCDDSLSFIDIHVGRIGVTRKNKVFKESQLSKELNNFVDFDNHILGDSDYKLRTNLITPYTSDQVLTPEDMKFNEVHWRTRNYIGHAFELLKERFKKLNYMDIINKPESIQILICAACVLHNFVLLHEGCPDVKEEPVTCEDAVTIDSNIVKTAEEKRQFLCNYISFMEKDIDSS